MNIIGLDGKNYKLKLSTNISDSCSKPHKKARELLNKYFPNHTVYEEITLLGTKRFNKGVLFADFLIPAQRLLVEVHGEQHYRKTYFHSTKLDFVESQARDRRKVEWCELNNIIFVELPSGESEDEWRYRLDNRI